MIEVAGRQHPAFYAHTFADVEPGDLLVYQDASRTLALRQPRPRGQGARARARPRGAPAAGMSAALGRPRRHHRLTDSTNARARDLAGAGAPHGTLVTAGEQTAGRGRQGRTWVAPPGRALLMSLVVRPPSPLIPLAAGVAVAELVGGQIKWPNDVLLDDRKVAGILVEGRPRRAGQCWGSG